MSNLFNNTLDAFARLSVTAPLNGADRSSALLSFSTWIGTLSPSAQRAVKGELTKWMNWFSHSERTAAPYEAESVTAYVSNLNADGASIASVCRALWAIKASLRHLGSLDQECELVIARIQAESERMRGSVSKNFPSRPRATWSDISTVLKAANPDDPFEARLIAPILLIQDTLARLDEIFGLRINGEWHKLAVTRSALHQLSDGSGRITLNRTTHGDNGLGLYVAPLTMQWIGYSNRGRLGNDGPLFVTRRNTPFQSESWKQSLEKFCEKRSLPDIVRLASSLRSGMVGRLVEAGATPDEVRELGGWTTMESVTRHLRKKRESDSILNVIVSSCRE